jgi:tetratricopeptide (TPR) repeat protein
MVEVRAVNKGVVPCLALMGLLACHRSPSDTAAAEPEAPKATGAGPAAVALGLGSPEDLAAEIDRAQWLHTAMQTDGDGAEQARARFALAEAYMKAASGIGVLRFDLTEQRLAEPSRPRPDLDRLDAELAAQQATWLEHAAREHAEVIRSTDPAAVELRPRARHGLAEVQHRQGDRAAMLRTLRALVHDDPSHPLASSAWLQLADAAFEDQRLDEARALYEQVLVLGTDDRLYARYKLGWVALNLDDGQAALEHWAAVAREGREDPRQRTLAENAARDCVLAYARVGRPERAKAFFDRLDPEHAPLLLQKLVSLYEDEGRPDEAARVLGGSSR